MAVLVAGWALGCLSARLSVSGFAKDWRLSRVLVCALALMCAESCWVASTVGQMVVQGGQKNPFSPNLAAPWCRRDWSLARPVLSPQMGQESLHRAFLPLDLVLTQLLKRNVIVSVRCWWTEQQVCDGRFGGTFIYLDLPVWLLWMHVLSGWLPVFFPSEARQTPLNTERLGPGSCLSGFIISYASHFLVSESSRMLRGHSIPFYVFPQNWQVEVIDWSRRWILNLTFFLEYKI